MSDGSKCSYEGGCTCGEIRYRLNGSAIFVHCCDCTWCQRETGSAFVINAMIEADRMELLQGQVVAIDTPSPSGKGQKISRCPTCKIALWSNYAGAGDAIHFIRVGTLDNPNSCPPDIHIYTSTKQDWVEIPVGMPTVEEYYRSREYWPEESLARIKILKAS